MKCADMYVCVCVCVRACTYCVLLVSLDVLPCSALMWWTTAMTSQRHIECFLNPRRSLDYPKLKPGIVNGQKKV